MPKCPLRDADLTTLTIPRSDEPEAKRHCRKWHRTLSWSLAGLLVLAGGYVATTRLVPGAVEVEVSQVVLSTANGLQGSPPARGLVASGYVVAQRQASVASKGSGRLEYLGVAVGDRVKAGQIIARLEHADVDAELRREKAKLEVARAALANAKPELHDATRNYERSRALMTKSFITRAEFDTAEARLRHAKAAVRSAEGAIKAAEAEVQAAEVQVENTTIRAPFDGTVLKKFAEVGEVVAPLAASASSRGAILSIADLSSLLVEADVSESMIGHVQVGRPADITIDAVPGRHYHGEVVQIVPTADRSKATVLTKVKIVDLDEKVLPEMSAKVMFLPAPGEGGIPVGTGPKEP